MARLKKFLPHEQMMERFEKENRVHREELSLKRLTLDHRLQAREKPLDVDNVKELHGYVKGGQTLAPIVVFRVDGKDYVTNGFHRTEVHRKEKLPSILADVVDGTWQEAVEFAACCNLANHALTPTPADKKKAVMMLLANGWLSRSASEIARHSGAGTAAVVRWITEHCEASGAVRPAKIVMADGRKMKANHGGLIAYDCPSRRGRFSAVVGGKAVHVVAKTKEEATEKLLGVADARNASLASLRGSCAIATYLSSRDIWFDLRTSPRLLAGGKVRQFAVTFVSEDISVKSTAAVPLLISAVGRAVMLGEYFGFARKIVLVFEPIKSHEELIDIARRLGVEFMTLEQFVEAVKADTADDGDAAATA